MQLFLRWITTVTLFISTSIFAAAMSTHDAMVLKFREGVHYKTLDLLDRTRPPMNQLLDRSHGKVQVIEFFNYGCHWCHRLDPYVLDWLKHKPAKVDFIRVPVAFSADWEMYGKAYYTAILLSALDKIHTPLFEAIQTEHKNLSTEAAMQDFFTSKGIGAAEFDKMLHSFSVAHEMQFAGALARAYQITGIPTIVVNGKQHSYLTDTKMAGNGQMVFEIVDFLLAQEAAEARALKAAKDSKK